MIISLIAVDAWLDELRLNAVVGEGTLINEMCKCNTYSTEKTRLSRVCRIQATVWAVPLVIPDKLEAAKVG